MRTTGGVPGEAELTGMLALSMALAALGVDLLLPAFGAIRATLGLRADSTAVAGLVTAYFLGLAAGQLLYGPLADRFGRRRALYLGYAIYGLAALAGAFASSLVLLLATRFVWGVGAAGPRVITFAVIRDRYDGDRMSRAMSFVMAMFILVPIIAPSVGAAIIAVASWRWAFVACAVAAVAMAGWNVRLPETLRDEHRMDRFRLDRIAAAVRTVLSHRRTVGYTLGMTALYGAFVSYIASAELIFGQAFGRSAQFPFIFGGLAAVMAVAVLTNAKVVRRTGVRRLAHTALLVYVGVSAGLLALALLTGGRPPLAAFLVVLAAQLACHAFLIPNLNTIALDPVASVAGTASSLSGAVQIAGGALLGMPVDRAFRGTITPHAVGFLTYGLLAVSLVLWAERGRLFHPP